MKRDDVASNGKTMSTSKHTRRLGPTGIEVGPIAYGLWRFVGNDVKAARTRIETALDAGMTLIDVAAVYGLDWGGSEFGESETLLGKVLADAPGLRSRMVLATKFGIIPRIPYDSGAPAVIRSCEESLLRLGIDCIDLFQVHRPDVLTHPTELAEALTKLRAQGKIREAGVSNYNARQTLLLQQFLDFPLATMQPEFSALAPEGAFDGVLDFAISRGMTPLAWSPLAGGKILEDSPADPAAQRVAKKLDELVRFHGTSRTAIALAFVMRHPSNPSPIVGTQNPARIAAATDALRVSLSRTDWYALVVAAQGKPLP